MTKKINTKLVKLIKYYSLINYNLIYDNKSLNRYKFVNNYQFQSNKDKELKELKENIEKIKNCELKKSSKNIVFSDGNPNSKIMIIGEGPGANEDLEGMPFIGRAGQLLDKMLSSINLNRNNEIIDPKILILLGSTALNTIIGDQEVISKVRGKWFEKKIGKCSTFVIASFHPAFLIRQPGQKAMSWIDLKMIRQKINELNIKIEK